MAYWPHARGPAVRPARPGNWKRFKNRRPPGPGKLIILIVVLSLTLNLMIIDHLEPWHRKWQVAGDSVASLPGSGKSRVTSPGLVATLSRSRPRVTITVTLLHQQSHLFIQVEHFAYIFTLLRLGWWGVAPLWCGQHCLITPRWVAG